MTKKIWIWALVLGTAFGLTACGDNGDTIQQEMQQERPEEMLDEREDEQLNAPGVEYNQEQMENRLDEREDER